MVGTLNILERTSGSLGPEYYRVGEVPIVPQSQDVGTSVRARVLVYGSSDAVLEAIAATIRSWESSIAFESIEICDQDSESEFADRVERLAGIEDALLVVSDRFATPSGGGERYDLARVVRERTSEAKAVVGLLAVIDPPYRRVGFVDGLVERSANRHALRQAVDRVLCATRYKLPPKRPCVRTPAVEVRPVTTAFELRQCLALRYQVYKLLNYHFEGPEDEPANLELDYYDASALHFIAVAADNRIAGTARLIVADGKTLRGSLFRGAAKVRRDSRVLCAEIAAESPTLEMNLERGMSGAALPLFAAYDYDELDASTNTQIGDFCEISRVVVAEEFRGMGVSRLLARACTAAAFDLQQRYVLLECIPQHVRMYEKYGFSKIKDSSNRHAWSINQLLAVMSLHLEDEPGNLAVQIAKRDLDMMSSRRLDMSSRKALCLCGKRQCWDVGEYGSKGSRDCPIKASFMH
jgi:predicted GNAT family N-acyltransferase